MGGRRAGHDGPDAADATTGARWNKQEYVGDRGEGAPAPQDPDTMPEGETGLSGDRHTPGEEHLGPRPGDRPRRLIASVARSSRTMRPGDGRDAARIHTLLRFRAPSRA